MSEYAVYNESGRLVSRGFESAEDADDWGYEHSYGEPFEVKEVTNES